MGLFSLYLGLGFSHIADLNGYDHILFIIALCIVYPLKRWLNVLILVTAFTLGHTLTLALATLGVIRVSTAWIEFLIPVTILFTALWNIVRSPGTDQRTNHRVKYIAASFFGLIHGLGFSSYLQSLLGEEQNLLVPLLAFNVGVELGQILIVLAVMMASFILVDFFRIKRWDWNLVMSGGAISLSLVMALERIPL